MPKSEPEPLLTLKLSDRNEFHCSACQRSVTSVGNGRFVVVGITDLIASFEEHVSRFHGKEDGIAREAAKGR